MSRKRRNNEGQSNPRWSGVLGVNHSILYCQSSDLSMSGVLKEELWE